MFAIKSEGKYLGHDGSLHQVHEIDNIKFFNDWIHAAQTQSKMFELKGSSVSSGKEFINDLLNSHESGDAIKSLQNKVDKLTALNLHLIKENQSLAEQIQTSV